jgi:hypothetical protein
LLPWTIPVVLLYGTSALAAIPERAPGIRYGASMDYLAALAGFATELVARGRVLPTLDHDGASAVARWRPVIQGPDVATMHALTAAMPRSAGRWPGPPAGQNCGPRPRNRRRARGDDRGAGRARGRSAREALPGDGSRRRGGGACLSGCPRPMPGWPRSPAWTAGWTPTRPNCPCSPRRSRPGRTSAPARPGPRGPHSG